jgi:hypothetical protein
MAYQVGLPSRIGGPAEREGDLLEPAGQAPGSRAIVEDKGRRGPT